MCSEGDRSVRLLEFQETISPKMEVSGMFYNDRKFNLA